LLLLSSPSAPITSGATVSSNWPLRRDRPCALQGRSRRSLAAKQYDQYACTAGGFGVAGKATEVIKNGAVVVLTTA
jgi:hypothetical protein